MAGSSNTVYDIARLAGVSPATVSRVLTGNTRVAPEKVQRIREVMAQLNYRPNANARTLLRKRSLSLGVIMPDITNLFFSQTFLALERAAYARGYSLLLGNTISNETTPDRDLEAFYLDFLMERQVDGILYMGGRVNATNLEADKIAILKLADATRPIVAINGRCPQAGLFEVSSAEDEGIEALVDHLYRLGHREFALLGGIPGITAFEEKARCLKLSLGRRGLELNPSWLLPTNYSLEAGFEAMGLLLQQPSLPTAVLAINDYVAMGAVRCAVSRGFRVPEDFSVTGFDDIQTSGFAIPSLTTVNHSYTELAQVAVQVIIDRIEGLAPPALTIVPTFLVVRESTGPVKEL